MKESPFNQQFAEDGDERAERQRKARLAARCPSCGRNPKIGQSHTPECVAPRAPGAHDPMRMSAAELSAFLGQKAKP